MSQPHKPIRRYARTVKTFRRAGLLCLVIGLVGFGVGEYVVHFWPAATAVLIRAAPAYSLISGNVVSCSASYTFRYEVNGEYFYFNWEEEIPASDCHDWPSRLQASLGARRKVIYMRSDPSTHFLEDRGFVEIFVLPIFLVAIGVVSMALSWFWAKAALREEQRQPGESQYPWRRYW